MSRKRTSNDGGGKFKRLLGWTVLMAIVFSAGLITGERLVRREKLAPLVAVTDQVDVPGDTANKDDADKAKDKAKHKKKTTFAFFDQLTRKDDVSLSSERKAASKKHAPTKHAPAKHAPAPKAKPAAHDSHKAAEHHDAPQKPAKKLAARYTLQVAAHPDLESAKAHMERLRKMGLEPHVVSATIPGKGKFYRVRVGKFHTMDEARNFQANLKAKDSLNTFVTPL